MTAWPKDTTKEKMAFYGDFRKPSWQEANLTRLLLPFTIRYEGKVMTKGILLHRKIKNATMLAMTEVWDEVGRGQKAIDKIGLGTFGGCFNIRKIAGSDNWSNHSWACALDFDPAHNGFNTGHGTMSPIVVNAFKAQGALWGGDYKGRTDPMHFEFVSR